MSFKIYPSGGTTKLELPKLQQLVFDYCESELGQRYATKMQVSDDFDFIQKALLQADSFKSILSSGENFPTDNYYNLEETLNYLEKENSVLNEGQFLQTLLFLRTVESIYIFFKKCMGKYPALEATLKNSTFNEAVLKAISKVISIEGLIKPGISPELDRIRKDIHRKENELQKTFQKIVQQAQQNGWVAATAESLKNGRHVLALHAEHKRKIKGIVHDESATGKTVFLEPEETIEISNDLFSLHQEERREIFRILKALSDEIRPSVFEIRFYQRAAGLFDFIRAKARLGLQLRAVMPQLSNSSSIRLRKAYHPLLLLHNLKNHKETIPLNIDLNEEKRILIISGPNAGGKSVALKTAGLLQVMLQCGMLVPVHEDSEMGIFSKLFVELGDEQSIENDLSTYSSHLTHIKHFTEQADMRTLFLIDEFGTGTDPKFGGAIAEAVLEELLKKKSIGIVTTHFSNLKLLASGNGNIVNGSMIFDQEKLAPLFILKTGEPGSSHTFEIAQKIGLQKNIIKSAKAKVDKNYENFDALLATMETEKHWLILKQKKLEEDQQALTQLIDSYTKLKEDIEKNKSKILLENKQKALMENELQHKKLESLISSVQKEDIKNMKDVAAEARQEILKNREKLKADIGTLKAATKTKKEPVEIAEGMYVRMAEGTETGRVEELRKNKALVSFKAMKTLVNINDLEVVKLAENNKLKKISGINYTEAASNFSPKIDVRGLRTDEALHEVEVQLDKAVLLNYHSITILHGKGDGILRKMIRQMLKKYDMVKDVRSEHADYGGDGITIVDLE
ncbi:MAG: endonuclease MutS2 [Bacteroidia bacterium]